jgi:hypothetical protein
VPSPSPSPLPSAVPSALPSEAPPPTDLTGIALLAPKDGFVASVPAGTKHPEVKVDFKWRARPAGKDLLFTLWKLKSKTPDEISRDEVDRLPLKSKKLPMSLTRVIKAAGDYEWEILDGNGGSLASLGHSIGRFRVEGDFEGIEVLDPLIGGAKGESNQVQDTLLENFDVTLNWKPFPGAHEYKIEFFSPGNPGKAIKSITTAETHHALNKGKIFTGRIFYRISAALTGGFEVSSGQKAFLFDFLPPLPVQPAPGATVSESDVQTDGILFTWQKTNFTDSYDLEIASDAAFKTIVTQENLTDNFLIVESPGPGTFYWRTRSHSQGVTSTYSKPAKLVIGP